MKVRVHAFAGTAPRKSPHLLPESMAVAADNVRLTSGSLRALNSSAKSSAVITAGTKSIYSLGSNLASVLLSWAADVDVARAPISDSEYKIYYTDGTTPRKTNYSLATSGGAPYPSAWYHMGTPAPTAAATLAGATTTTNLAAGTYSYVFTYVTQFGSTLLEESAPSPAQTVTLASPGQVTVTFPSNPSTTDRNYVKKRIYRGTSSTYVLVAEVPFTDASFVDTLSASAIPGTALPSLGWLPPPSDLQGICALPSGVLVGFRSNEIWFCEPGYPHAWPVKYMQALDSTIVAIKAFGNNVAVATLQYPYLGTGLYPDGFTFTKLPLLEPCVSKRSMASDEDGAIYASRNGLVTINLNNAEIVTRDLCTRQEFAAYTPDSMLGIVFEGRYYGFYTTPGATGSTSAAIVVGKGESIGLKTVGISASAATIEPFTNQCFYVGSSDNLVYSLDPVGTVPMTYVWESKRFELPAPTNFSCFQVLGAERTPADDAAAAATTAANAAIAAANVAVLASGIQSELNSHELNGMSLNGSLMQDPLPSYSTQVGVVVYAAGQAIYGGTVDTNKMYRLPGGFKAIGWRFRLTGQAEISGFEMATSANELKAS